MIETLEKSNVLLSEEEKKQDDYLMSEIDASIAACLTGEKDKLIQAYNQRNGVRNADDFNYLWSAYGIEFPAQMRHVPVLRAIFDSLVGQAINRPLKPNITCDDTDSVNYIFQEHRDQILKEVSQFWKNKIQAATMVAGDEAPDTVRAQEFLKKLEKKYNEGGFQADIEIAAKRMLTWAIQKFKVRSNLMTFAEDLVAGGQCYYQVKVTQIGRKPISKVVNPLSVFYTKGSETKFIKDCPRVVLKERVPVSVVWSLYGHKMKKIDQDRFVSNWGKYIVGSNMEIIDYEFGTLESKAQFPIQELLNEPMIDVSYVEWKANTKVPMVEVEESSVEGASEEKLMKLKKRYKFQLDRYEGTRIGEDIYVEMGKSKFVVRDPDDPSNVPLSINGICYNDRNGEPYSMVLKTKDIADKIDILHYHAENLLAISGTKAIVVNYPDIPVWMGDTEQQRIMKWLGYVKQGVSVVDFSQEGNGVGKFNNMADVDLSMSTAILSIYQMLEQLEATAYKVTGVSRQSVGIVTQSDGKGTSQIAIQGSEIVTAPLFATYDEIVEQYLTDLVNACRIAYSEGLVGKILLGEDGQKVFSIKSKQFNLAYLNVHVNMDGSEQRDLEDVKLVAHKLIDNQMLDAKIAFDVITIKSLTELKAKVKKSFEEKEQSTAEQTTQQLEQYKAELDKATKALEQLQGKHLELKEREVAIKGQESKNKADLKVKELDQKNFVDNKKVDNDSRRVELEALQLAYGNSGNQEIRNN